MWSSIMFHLSINELNGNVMTASLSVTEQQFTKLRHRRSGAVSKRPDTWQVNGMEALEVRRYSESFPCGEGLRGRASGQEK